MSTIQNIEFINEVDEKETQDVINVLASSLYFNSTINTKKDLQGKSVFISFFSKALEEVIQNDVVKSKKDRLKVIKFIDKLKQQKSAIDLANGIKINFQIAAERLGKKAQSSFSAPASKKRQLQ